MRRGIERRRLLQGAGVALAGVAGCLGSGGGDATDGPTDASDSTTVSGTAADGDWRTATLTDVRSGEPFTVDDLAADGPVLLETFAVWCSTCLRQQRELRAYHEAVPEGAVSVSLNVDPNEDAAKVRRHLEEHGFDWRYAVAPSEATRSLVDQFGQSIAHPPSAPVVLVCPGGSRRLPDGVKNASSLEKMVGDGC